MAISQELHEQIVSPTPTAQANGETPFLPPLQNFLRVTAARYEACIAHVDHDYIINGTAATIRLHYVRMDANGEPKFKELAEVLAGHIGYYAVMAQRHREAKDHYDHAKIHLDGKRLLRRYAKSGEPGELLLYFLIEAVLKAPQAICKMSLKTNTKDEVKGSDGVHVKWDQAGKRLIVYFGEAKLYTDLSAALTAAFESMANFHAEDVEQHEVFLVSNHFNLLNGELKEHVCRLLDKTASPVTYEAHHACFVGFDWGKYGDLHDTAKRRLFAMEFECSYREHGAAIRAAVEGRMNKFTHRHLTFEFFFIPFKSVNEFREMFMKAVFGEVKG